MHNFDTLRRPRALALLATIMAACFLSLLACGAPPAPASPLPSRLLFGSQPTPAPIAPPQQRQPTLPRSPGQWRVLPATDPLAQVLPATPREFRGLWVATVDNIDWPSTKSLSAAAQQGEITRILDLALSLNFNAIILQVRPMCDAIYPSTIEPWSEFLTGRSGRPPNPPYDPLKVWIDAAHARGLHLHAWINPFRARHPKAQFPDASSHVSKTHPAMVKSYGEYLWLDPGEPWVQDRSLGIVRDLLSRYDLDGIHIDDYFYPYPQGKLEFDDRASFARYKSSGGSLPRDAWRRSNVDRFVERLYKEVKTLKRTALVGISPFGIWRPGNPPGIQSMDPYVQIHADSRKWLQEGWLDYIAPQLYWPVASKGQPFEPLLTWWVGQNTKRRHIWPGIYTSRVGSKEAQSWNAAEIARQIDTTRRTAGAGGVVHFSAAALIQNRPGLLETLRQAYASPAIIPASSWLDATLPPLPIVAATRASGAEALVISLGFPSEDKPFRYVISTEYGPKSWQCIMVTGDSSHASVPVVGPNGAPLGRVVVSAVDRLGNESARVVLVP